MGTKAKPHPTVLYGGGKVHVSFSKKGYRVFLHSDDVVDKCVKWDNFKNHKEAWDKACELIEEANA